MGIVPRPFTLTPEQLQKVQEMAKQGSLYREIAEVVGVTPGRIGQLVGGGRGQRRKLDRDKAIRAMAVKTPVPEIAIRYGISKARVYQILQTNG